MEMDVLRRLKSLNKRAVVVLAEVLYCPEHRHFNAKLHSINRQVRRLNRAASGLASPKPWRVLGEVQRAKNRWHKDRVLVFPNSFSRDGYHISVTKIVEYEAELSAYMRDMVTSDSASTSGNPA